MASTTISLETLRLFIEERFRQFNPRENLDAGSPARVQVIDPIVRRFSPDPLEPDLKRFALVRLQQEFPNLYAKEGAALADTLVKPMQVLLEPLRREIRGIKRNQSMIDPSTLAPAEADALMFNVFVRRRTGNFARLKVRIYFPNPMSVVAGSTNFAFTGTGLRFIPRGPQSITAQSMLFNQDGDLFYFDVDYIAEAPGSRYNVGASKIIGVTGMTAATRATNLAKAEFGDDEETTIEMIERGEKSIGERSLTTVPGSVAVLFEQFSDLQILQIIGFNDPEMQRDVITGGNRGPILLQASDGATPNDGSLGSYTGWFDSSSVNFTTELGPVGTDISGHALTIIDPTDIPPTFMEFDLGEVLGASRVKISDDYSGSDRLPQGRTGLLWNIRSRETLTLSGIPGGILFPDELATEVEIRDNEVHVGGCADMMVKGATIEDKSLAVPVVSDQNVVARRYDADFTAGLDWVTLNDLTEDEYNAIDVGKPSLWVKAGSGPSANLGVYRIISKAVAGGPTYLVEIQVDSSLIVTGTGYSYEIVDDIDVNLNGPKEIKYEGNDLQTFAGSPVVNTVGGLPNFVDVGVTDEDVVEIVNGDDRGVYPISTGGVFASQIILDTPLIQTDGPLQYKIYRLEDGITLPLLRVKSLEMLDSSFKPLGSYIPYRHPIDARSNSFQNPGRGAKAGTSLDVDDLITRGVAIGYENVVTCSLSINYYDIGVRRGDILNVNTGDNRGFYAIIEVGGQAGVSIADNQLRVDRDMMWPSVDMNYDVGPPSYGSFRLYFLDPVTFEASYEETYFSVTLPGGSSIRYRPDPEVMTEFLPTSSTVPGAAAVDGVNELALFTLDGSGWIGLAKYGVAVGDRVEVTYAPIVGAIDLSAGGLNLDGKTLVIDVGKGPETVLFTGTSLSLDLVVSQINSQLTSEVASKYTRTSAPAGEYLMLRGDQEITLKGWGTATTDLFDDAGAGGNSRSVFMPWLTGEFAGSYPYETEDDSPIQGKYDVNTLLSVASVTLNNLDGSAWGGPSGYDIDTELGHYVHFSHVGIQRISSTAMSEQGTDDLGFYYFDVECISEGYGDTYNIGEDEKASSDGYYSEGWSISVEDENLSYSMAEVPLLDISPRILVEGVEDDPDNATELIMSNVQVDYERMPLVQHVHTFSLDKQNRVVCESPLSRALFPTFIRTFIQYRGGPTEADARTALVDVITNTIPEEDLEVSDLHDEIRRLGSSKVVLPITLVGIEHKADRTIDVARSQDAISTDRLSAMIPDDDGTTVEGASYIFLEREIS